MPRRKGRLRLGCSGWHYKEWRGRFYPADLPASRWLSAYARVFDTVELNASFYRLPTADQFAAWRAQVPRDFTFAVKASRYLTHIKRLREPEPPLALLLGRARRLGPTLGPVLYQLPPRWIPDADRLETFMQALPRRIGSHRVRHVLEMRDPHGYDEAVLARARRHRVAFCVHDFPGMPTPRVRTSRLIYVRFHGYGQKYGGSYPRDVLADWAVWCAAQLAQGVDVYAYFNNDIDGWAVQNALTLRSLLDRLGTAVPTVRTA